MRTIGCILALVAAFSLPFQAGAQDLGIIQGTVTNVVTGQPVAGVQISIVGTQLGVITARDGSYTIRNVPAGTHEVRATHIAYTGATETVTVDPAGVAQADFELRETRLAIEGIIVTGAGELARRREIGNAIASIQPEAMDLGPVNSLQDLLVGRAAGVTVRSSGGTTGTGQRIRIRGANSASLSNEPLVIIDGIRVTNQGPAEVQTASTGQRPVRLNDLNPEDIESIEVLRGPAAAALYGTAAANGVLQITTRRGRAGDASWNFYAEYGEVEDRNPYPENVRAFGTAPDGSEMLCDIFSQGAGLCTPERWERLNVLRDPRTTPFRTGARQKWGVNVAGGTETTSYYVSADLEDERGVYRTNWMDRTGVRANVEHQLRDGMRISARSGFTSTRTSLPQNDNNAFSFLLNGLLGGTAFQEGDPLSTVYRVGLSPDVVETRREESDNDRFIGSLSFDWNALDWLSVSATGGVDYFGQHDHILLPGGTGFAIFGSPHAEGFRSSHRMQQWVYTATASAAGSFDLTDELRSTTSVGSQYTHEIFERTYGFGADLLGGTGSLTGTGSLFSVTEENRELVMVGGFVRQQLSYRDRLFVTGTVRGDDDSAFGDEFGLAVYPGISVAWMASEEPFFPELPGVSSLRLRTAWGESGLRPGFRDADTFFDAVAMRIDGQEETVVTVGGTGNPDLKPERTSEWELGFELGLLDERVGLEFTYYDKESKDALVSRTLAPSLGLGTSQFVNLGAVTNQGVEMGLRATAVEMPDVRVDVGVNGSYNRNRLRELGEGVDPILFGFGEDTQRHEEGHSLGAYFHPPILGWEDLNGNGVIEPNEVQLGDEPTYHGHALPPRQIAVNTDITLFDLIRVSALFDHQGGHMLYDGTEFFRCAQSVGFFRCEEAFDPDTPFEDQARTAAAFAGTRAGFFFPADFWRFRELSVTLTAPQSWIGRVGYFERASLTLSGRNLKLWTDYPGVDPEVNSAGTVNHTTGDFFTQPPVRYLTARINLTF